MDDSKLKQISKKTLEKVLEKLNVDFINELPIPPEELLKFATRRTDPVISENISYSLGKSMLEHRLSDEDYLITFFKVINFVFSNKTPVDNPEASILISQTGAGKTNLREFLLRQNSNRVIINSDQYKRFRPDVQEILERDPTHFGALTGIDCYDHARNINDFAANQKYNLLIECAPTLSQGLVGVDLSKLEKNYDVNFQVLAVGDLVSALAIHYRYEKDIQEGRYDGSTKLTDINRHDESYKAVEEVIKELDPKKVKIYRRGTREENYVPIEIQDDNKTVLGNLRILNNERHKSNQMYTLSQFTDHSFKSDYETINNSMRLREAPHPQFEQLKSIYEKYISYITKSKGVTFID